MNLYQFFDLYSRSGEITSSGIYMLRSALKRLYEAYNLKESEEIEERSFSNLLAQLETYLRSQNKTSKVIRENKYWVRRLIKFSIQKKYLYLKNDLLTVNPQADTFSSHHFSDNQQFEILTHSTLPPINTESSIINDEIKKFTGKTEYQRKKFFITPWILKLIIVSFGLIVIGMLFITEFIHRQFENYIFDQYQQQQLIISQSVAKGLSDFLIELEHEINFLAQMPAVQLIDSRCQAELDKAYKINKKYIKSIRRVDADGYIHHEVPENKHTENGKLPYDVGRYFSLFKNIPEKSHNALIFSEEDNPILLIFLPVKIVCPKTSTSLSADELKNFGFIIVEIFLLKVAETFIEHIGSEEKGHGLLINHDGTILYHPNYKKIGQEFFPTEKTSNLACLEYKQQLLQKIKAKQTGFSKDFEYFQKKDQYKVFAFFPINIHEELWAVIFTAPYKEIHPVKRLHANIFILMIGLISLISTASFIVLKVNKKRIKVEEEIKFLEKKLEMEDQICRSEERLRAILNSIASDRISIIDRNLKILWANRVAFQNYGNIVGKKCYQAYKGIDAPCQSCPVQKTFLDGKIHSAEELAMVDRDGRSILYLTSSSPIRGKQDNIVSVVELSKDITERMRLLEEIKGNRDLLDAILSNINDGIRVIDTKYNILFMNQILIDLFGNQINQKCYRIFMGKKSPCNPCALEKILNENIPSINFLQKNIKKQLVEISATALGIKSGGRSIIEVVRDITERKRLETQLMESEQRRIRELKERYRFGNIIGKSQKIQEIYELIQVVSQNRTTVLLLGESGTGKELIARAIHYNSPQHDQPFVEVCCSVLSENLLESELFGHVKGAFTGAIRDKIGRFEMANNGSVFLDEVGDISLSVQVKLLRVIQEREFTPVGGDSVRKVNVRIIAATNKDLKKAVENKEFREDLYYRLNVIPIIIPPLRERIEDLPLLVNHFIEKFRKKIRKEIQSISSSAMKQFFNYSWPGNIRELENAIEHGFVKCDTSIIQPEDLPKEVCKGHNKELEKSFTQQDLNIRELKKEILIKVLDETAWDPVESAKKLKISRATFYRWLKKYGIKKKQVS